MIEVVGEWLATWMGSSLTCALVCVNAGEFDGSIVFSPRIFLVNLVNPLRLVAICQSIVHKAYLMMNA